MNKQPDQFFKDKLEGYQKQAPASAWEKIALSQAKKKHGRIWLKIAAAILLLSVAAFVLWPAKRSSDQQLAGKKETEKIDPAVIIPQQQQQPSMAKSEVPVNKENSALAAKRQRKPVVTKEKLSNPVAAQNDINGMPGERVEKENNTAMIQQAASSPEVSSNTEEKQPVEKRHTVTLVYTANDVSEYLNKKELDEATSDAKKPSTLKKLLKKANDLTSNQDPFGELRQKKNEILALSFKNEKRGQNK